MKKFIKENAGEQGTDELSYKYKKDTPGQSPNGKNMKEKQSDKALDIKSLEKLIKNPSPRMVKMYGKSKYINMLKKKLAKLKETIEESTLNYARTMKAIDKERKMKNISAKDKATLGKIADLMKQLRNEEDLEEETLQEKKFDVIFGGYASEWPNVKDALKKMRIKIQNYYKTPYGEHEFTINTTQSKLKQLMKRYGDLELQEDAVSRAKEKAALRKKHRDEIESERDEIKSINSESAELEENVAIVYNPRNIRAFIKQAERKFPKYKGEIKQGNEKDEIVFPNDPKLIKFFKGAREVKFVLKDSLDKDDIPFIKDLIKNLKKGSKTHGKQADDLEKALNELDENTAKFKKLVKDIRKLEKELSGAVKKGDAKTVDKINDKLHKARMAFVNYYSIDQKTGKKVFKEEYENKETESELQEAAPFKSLEQKWLATKGDKKKQERLIKKHSLKPIISKVRPGAIKLGVLNDLDAKGSKNATAAGLDADGELIFVTNNPTKIYYAKKGSKRPKGMELEDVDLNTLRLQRMCEVALGEEDFRFLYEGFISEAGVDLTWTTSEIQREYKKYLGNT